MSPRIVSLFSLILLSGCAANQAAPIPPAALVASDIDKAILAGLNRVADAYAQLAQIDAAKNNISLPDPYNSDMLPEVWGLEMNLLRDYHGHLGNFIALISAMAGINPPNIVSEGFGKPALITIRQGNRTLIDFIADAGYQVGTKAVVIADIANNQVTITYK
tara:strand:+ start:1084 stop:1569 length:486 start_codon:yes stop_codon:yes gene_type:complete